MIAAELQRQLDELTAVARAHPAAPGDLETDRRRRLGIAIGKLETVRYILSEAALELGLDTQLWVLSRQAARLAYATVQDLIVHGGSLGSDTERLTAAVSLMGALWKHPSGVLEDQVLRRLARQPRPAITHPASEFLAHATRIASPT